MTHRHRRRPRQPQGPGIHVTDTHNGWPVSRTNEIVRDEVRTAIASRDLETSARLEAIEQARSWNRLLSIFPLNILAQVFGMRPWSYFPPRKGRGRRRTR